MTVSSSSSKSPLYAGNGTTGPWAFSFKTFAASDLEVVRANASGIETVLALTTDYSVSLNADQNTNPGGEVTTVAVVPNDGSTIIIRWNGAATQGLDIQNAGGFYPEVIENSFDKLTMLVQKNSEELDRAVKVPLTGAEDPDALIATVSASAASASASASAAGASSTAAAASAASAAADAAAVASAKLTWKGPYSGATTYEIYDAVSSGGASYVSKADGNLNHTPPNATWWDVLAEKGTPGAGTGDMLGANNLSDVANAATSRTNLGLGDAATKNVGTAAGTVAAGDHVHSGVGLPFAYIAGLKLANNVTDATNDIDISIGEARDSTDAVDIALASALTKRLDAAWAVGTNQGGLDTGTVANNTYHVWLIKRSDTGVVDVLFSLSATAPTMPTNYDYKRRIGSIIRASAAIVPFVQDHIRFMRKTPVTDVSAAVVGNATAVTRTLSVPTGIRVGAINTLTLGAATSGIVDISYYVLSDLSRTDTAASTGNAHVTATWDGTAFGVAGSSGFVETMTNTSAQIRSKGYSTNYSGVTITIGTHGWVDYGLLSGS